MFKATRIESTPSGTLIRIERMIPPQTTDVLNEDGSAMLVEYLTEARWATLIKADGTDVDK